MTVYERIRERRKALGLTQQDVADALGYSNRSIMARIEAGEIDMGLSKFLQIADLLHFTPSELLGEAREGREARYEPDDLLGRVAARLRSDPAARGLLEAVLDVEPGKSQIAADLLRLVEKYSRR